jgi:transcription elongation factor GreA
MSKNKKTNVVDNEITLTRAVYDELQKELELRKEVTRKQIAQDISAASQLGDLSENDLYSDAMKRKEMNENKILELEDILAVAKIVEENKADNIVNIGEPVEVQNMESGDKRVIILVGSEETKSANPLEGKISVDSPIGKAIYNSKIGELVDVQLPGKTVQFKIVKFAKKTA